MHASAVALAKASAAGSKKKRVVVNPDAMSLSEATRVLRVSQVGAARERQWPREAAFVKADHRGEMGQPAESERSQERSGQGRLRCSPSAARQHLGNVCLGNSAGKRWLEKTSVDRKETSASAQRGPAPLRIGAHA
jgi:hypothetical protein